MKKILIAGYTNEIEKQVGKIVEENIFMGFIDTIGFIDNSSRVLSHKTYDLSDLNDLEYDYIIIGSSMTNYIYKDLVSAGVEPHKIVELYRFLYDGTMGQYYGDIIACKKNKQSYDGFITGMSYYQEKSDDLLKARILNLAYKSQDLYYDFNLARYILRNSSNSYEYAIIGLAYYSFNYQLRESKKYSYKAYFYDSNLKLKSDKYYVEKRKNDNSKSICEEFFGFNNGNNFIDNDGKMDYISLNEDEVDKYLMAYANSTGQVLYPNTMRENKIILQDYIEFLIKKGIRPIIIISPYSERFIGYLNEKMVSDFLGHMDYIEKKYDIDIIDFNDLYEFEDSDFLDGHHLNYVGDCKFKKELNNIINSY